MMEGSRTSSGSEKLYIYGTYPRFGSGGGEEHRGRPDPLAQLGIPDPLQPCAIFCGG